MSLLTPSEKETIIRRRGCISDRDGKKHPTSNLVIHHKDRNPNSNNPNNLRVLTVEEHQELHAKYG